MKIDFIYKKLYTLKNFSNCTFLFFNYKKFLQSKLNIKFLTIHNKKIFFSGWGDIFYNFKSAGEYKFNKNAILIKKEIIYLKWHTNLLTSSFISNNFRNFYFFDSILKLPSVCYTSSLNIIKNLIHINFFLSFDFFGHKHSFKKKYIY